MRGCVTTMLQYWFFLAWWSRMYCGTCVVLPLPVAPWITVTWLLSIVSMICQQHLIVTESDSNGLHLVTGALDCSLEKEICMDQVTILRSCIKWNKCKWEALTSDSDTSELNWNSWWDHRFTSLSMGKRGEGKTMQSTLGSHPSKY